MIDAVKSISPNATFEPLIWSWVNRCVYRERAVKSSIEDGNLRVFGKKFLGNVNALKPSDIVQRRNQGDIRNGLLNLGSHNRRLVEFGPAVDNAVSYNRDF